MSEKKFHYNCDVKDYHQKNNKFLGPIFDEQDIEQAREIFLNIKQYVVENYATNKLIGYIGNNIEIEAYHLLGLDASIKIQVNKMPNELAPVQDYNNISDLEITIVSGSELTETLEEMITKISSRIKKGSSQRYFYISPGTIGWE